MAWTSPRTWADGETVTAALMNAHVRDNESYLKTQMDIADRRQVLDNITAATAFTGDTSEHTLYTFSVPANTLGTTSMLRLVIIGTNLNGNGADTFRFKYGSTTLLTVVTTAVSLTATAMRLEFVLVEYTDTAHQRGLVSTHGAGFTNYYALGTATEDSTGALNLVVSYQAGHNSNSATLYSATLEVIAAV